jgi:hypothetical protein
MLGNFDNLTSLNITITAWTYHTQYDWKLSKGLVMDGLSMFLRRSPQLECLRIDLNNGNARTLVGRAVSTIPKVFGSKHTWPKLRKLSLCRFYATPDTLVSLLDRHCSTLKDLRLHDIHWEVDGSVTLEKGLDVSSRFVRYCAWPQVLQKVAECLSLEHATVSGMLGEIGWFGWRLDDDEELAAAISNYLICGGQCPLTADGVDTESESYHPSPPSSIASS